MAESVDFGRPARSRGEDKWRNVALPVVEHEDRMTLEEAMVIWNKIYGLFRATGEDARDEAKLAVYAYYAVNGASRQTPHTKQIRTGGGASVLSADVLDAIGSGDQIRRFLRADVDDAYGALKGSEVLSNDDVFSAKVIDKGVPRPYAHCAVDYLRGCSLFTPMEKEYADKAFSYSIRRARAARGGKSVDEIAADGRDDRISAQKERTNDDDEF